MKIVLRDYIKLLKEDNELDSLLVNLLFYMGVEPKSRPQKGRQYGVDILGVGNDEDGIKKLFIITVKQGNLDRNNWDTGKNAIRQSINEIIDVFIPKLLSEDEKKLPQKIIVAFNGILEQSVRVNWTGFVDTLKKRNVELVEWDIDKITLLTEKFIFSEPILTNDVSLLLRKTLSFIDINDYDLEHVISLYNKILYGNADKRKTVKHEKKLKLINICTNIIYKWAEQENNLRNALFAAEKATLLSWKYLIDEKLLEQVNFHREFYRIFTTLTNIQAAYLNKTLRHCYVKDSLAYTSKLNHSEYSLICIEYLGILSLSGLALKFQRDFIYKSKQKEKVANAIKDLDKSSELVAKAAIEFIKNNPGCYYPQYDEHWIDICLALLLMHATNNIQPAKGYISRLISTVAFTYSTTSFFPLFYSSHFDLVDSHVNSNREEQKSSMLLTHLIEWSIILNDTELYNKIRKTIIDLVPGINLQIWFPNENIEESLFTENSDRKNGKTKHSIMVPENPLEYKIEMIEETKMDELSPETRLSIFTYHMHYLGLLASRHYRTQVFPYYWRSLIQY